MLAVRVAVAVGRCSVCGLPVLSLAPFEWASAIWQCVGEKLVVSINTIRFIHLLINKFYSKTDLSTESFCLIFSVCFMTYLSSWKRVSASSSKLAECFALALPELVAKVWMKMFLYCSLIESLRNLARVGMRASSTLFCFSISITYLLVIGQMILSTSGVSSASALDSLYFLPPFFFLFWDAPLLSSY